MPAGARLYRRFLLFALPLTAVLGLATGATALVALCAWMAALLGLALVRSRHALFGLRVARHTHGSAFEDEPVRVDLRLENRSPRPACLIGIEDVFGPSIADHKLLLEPGPLPPARRRALAYRSTCSRGWGEYRLGPLWLSAADAAGLFEARRAFLQLDPFTVFPRVHPVAGLRRFGARETLLPQERTAGRVGQSLAYLGVRDYRPGDDLRRIHWPASARLGALAVKEHEIEIVPHFTLFLDLHGRGRAGTGRKSTLEYVVRTAASLVWQAATDAHLVEVVAAGAKPLFVPPGQGSLHATFALYELVRSRQEGRIELLDLVQQHAATLARGSTVALLSASLELDPARLQALLATLAMRNVRALVLLVDDASFVQVVRPQRTLEAARERRAALADVLARRELRGTILDAGTDIAAALARLDLPAAAAGGLLDGVER